MKIPKSPNKLPLGFPSNYLLLKTAKMKEEISRLKKLTSIQISSDVHIKLKEFCKEKGYKLSGFVENIILREIENKSSNE